MANYNYISNNEQIQISIDENVRLIQDSTLSNMANSIRSRLNNNSPITPINFSNAINNVNFGIVFVGGYGGAAINAGTSLNKKYSNNKTWMFPIVGNEVTDMFQAFNGCSNLAGEPMCGSNVWTMYQAYKECINLVGNAATGINVNNLSEAYYNCSNLNGIITSYTPKVVNAHGAFFNCSNLIGPLTIWTDPYLVNDISQAFEECVNLTGSNTVLCPPTVINGYRAYYNCQNITGSVVLGPNLNNVQAMYYECHNINAETSSNIPNIRDMSYIFYNCYNLRGNGVSGKNATNMAYSYYECQNLDGSAQILNNVTDATAAFYNCSNLHGSPFVGTKAVNLCNVFWNCINMHGSVDLPATVKNINAGFYNCECMDTIVIRPTNASILSKANMLGAFIRTTHNKRLNIIFAARGVYNVAKGDDTIVGCTLGTEVANAETILMPYAYANGEYYGYSSINVARGCFNEEYNIYLYSIQ